MIYSSTTQSIRVSVEPTYLQEASEPSEDKYIWSYQVIIENLGAETVVILKRHWLITDSFGRIHEVHGAGLVGYKPVLSPGEIFEYKSSTPLETPSGIMGGSYRVSTNDGHEFEVEIPTFSLDSPYDFYAYQH